MAIPIDDYLAKLPKEQRDAIQQRTEELANQQRMNPAAPCTAIGADLIGALRDDAELLDEIVDDAMRRRQISAWLPNRDDFTALEAMAEETGRPLHELLDEALRLLLLHHREHG